MYRQVRTERWGQTDRLLRESETSYKMAYSRDSNFLLGSLVTLENLD